MSLDSVKDATHDAGAELDREWFTGAEHGVANGDARSLLVHLQGVTRGTK